MHIVSFMSSDGDVFEMDLNAMKMSTTLQTMMDTMGNKEQEIISLKKFNSTILRLIVSWMNHHVNDPHPEDVRRIEGFKDDYYSSELYDFDKELLKECSMYILFQLSLAAHYLEVEGLLIFASMGVANRLKSKNVLQLKAEMGACVRRLRLKVTENMSAEEREMIEWMHAVEEMQQHIDEVVDFEPMDYLGVDDHLHSNNMKPTPEQELENIEWSKRVEEMQVYLDEVIVFDPVECQRMAELLRSNESNDTLEKDQENIAKEERDNISAEEREEIEWRKRVEEMQEDIDQIVEFGPMA